MSLQEIFTFVVPIAGREGTEEGRSIGAVLLAVAAERERRL